MKQETAQKRRGVVGLDEDEDQDNEEEDMPVKHSFTRRDSSRVSCGAVSDATPPDTSPLHTHASAGSPSRCQLVMPAGWGKQAGAHVRGRGG